MPNPGIAHSVRTYYRMTRQEWLSLAVTAAVAGFCLSFNDWGDESFDAAKGVSNLLFSVVAMFALLAFHVVVQKVVGVIYGVKVDYDKYPLGLLIGVFVTFLSFGYWPLFITGSLSYASIPNLRIGHFRATLPKKWEVAMIAAAGPIASMVLTIPLGLLGLVTGAAMFHTLIGFSLLIAIYALLPLPLLQTPNPYQVYMSRLESLEGNLPGYDIFAAAPVWFFFVFGMVLTFAVMTWIFDPSVLLLVIATLLGAGTMVLYTWVVRTFLETA